jgi:hypothetical protein
LFIVVICFPTETRTKSHISIAALDRVFFHSISITLLSCSFQALGPLLIEHKMNDFVGRARHMMQRHLVEVVCISL